MKRLQNKLLLVVDDEPDIREILKEELEELGAEVIEASCGNEAIEILKNRRFDAVLTDANMPNGNGLQLIKHIRSVHTSLPIAVVITGHSEFSDIEAYAAGASAVFGKPIIMNEVVSRLEMQLLPPESRWSRKSERIKSEFEVLVHLDDLQSSVEARVLDIGNGGMFVHLASDLPAAGKPVTFTIIFKKESPFKSIQGKGIIRWTRANGTPLLKSGFGLEFTEVENLSDFLSYLKQKNTPSFIPAG